MKKLLPTSTAGSLPKPSWLAEPEKLWSPWKLQGHELTDGKNDALRVALQEQQQTGIDIVSDGEQTRQHFVTTFIEHLNGVDFEKRETVKIRDRYDASVPTVVGPVSRPHPVFVEDAKFLREQTDQPIKWALPGPMTLVDTLYDNHYKSRQTLAWEFAKILNQEAKALEAVGVDLIQFDEPAFNVFFDEVSEWGIRCLEKAIEGLKLIPQRPTPLFKRKYPSSPHPVPHELRTFQKGRGLPKKVSVSPYPTKTTAWSKPYTEDEQRGKEITPPI